MSKDPDFIPSKKALLAKIEMHRERASEAKAREKDLRNQIHQLKFDLARAHQEIERLGGHQYFRDRKAQMEQP